MRETKTEILFFQNFEKQLNPGERVRGAYKVANEVIVKPSGSLMYKIISSEKEKFSLLPFPLYSFYFLVFSHWSKNSKLLLNTGRENAHPGLV